MTCTFSIECSTILNNWDDLKESKAEFVPADGWILYPSEVEFYEGETVFDAATNMNLEENDGSLDMKVDYALDMNQEHVADCYLAIKAQPKDCKDFTI